MIKKKTNLIIQNIKSCHIFFLIHQSDNFRYISSFFPPVFFGLSMCILSHGNLCSPSPEVTVVWRSLFFVIERGPLSPPVLTLCLCPQCHTLLYVYNLPANKDGKSISNRLRRLSDNCGGKVLNITGCSAILRFINRDSAERALKRMENEDVFGNRIIVSFTPKSSELCETKSSNATADKVKSPKKLKNPKLCLIKDISESPSSAKAAPGKGLQANSGSATKNTNVKSLQVTDTSCFLKFMLGLLSWALCLTCSPAFGVSILFLLSCIFKTV